MSALDAIRARAVARTLFAPTTIARAITRLGFVQADPIRAPARAQDLVLRHRVAGYRAGDLERRYPSLALEEDVFINYGFLPRATHALMHPRPSRASLDGAAKRHAKQVLAFVAARGEAHPSDVDAHFAAGRVRNAWGGTSSATTHLLDALHYAGHLRVVRRDGGVRVYAVRPAAPPTTRDREATLDALVDVLVRSYAPMTARGLATTIRRLRYPLPHHATELSRAIERAKARLVQVRAAGHDWFHPDEPLDGAGHDGTRARLLAPFDPIVWDRDRFALLWGWTYRFEAYTKVELRKLGYYALPLLWREHVIGWANLSVVDAALSADVGFFDGRSPDRALRAALSDELGDVARFLGVTGARAPTWL